jgi:hypothetical protein
VVGRRVSSRESRGKYLPFAEAGLFSIRRDAFREIPDGQMSVETFLALRLMRDGWRVVYEPEAIARIRPLGLSGLARAALGAWQAVAHNGLEILGA